MAGYENVMQSDPNLLPVEYSSEVIKQMHERSAVLALSRVRQMSTRTQRMPATTALAGAYWVGESANDFTNLKQTTTKEWKGVNLIVEELAVLVPIPHAYRDDINFNLQAEIVPDIAEAMGAALDAAVLFGVNKPATWPTALLPSIQAAGQTLEEGTTDDVASDIALSAEQLVERGFDTTGFATRPGFQWHLTGLRNEDGTPIYQTNLAGPITTGLYGIPTVHVKNGSWDSDEATVIHGDWSKSIVGIRQDITVTTHESGVITDEGGSVVFNAMQQDATVLRAVFRVAWTRANPATRLAPNADQTGDNSPGSEAAPVKFPFAALVPAGDS